MTSIDKPRRRLGIALCLAAASACAGLSPIAHAQASTYPDRSIRMVYGFAAGGPADYITRLVSQRITEELGQPVVVDSRPGAGANIAAGIVAKAAPDGYTLLMGAMNQSINPTLYNSLQYDQLKELTPIAMAAFTPNIIVVPASSPAHSLNELIALAKAKPGTVTYASTGIGTSTHLGAELFASMTGTQLVHVPYKGASPAETDLMTGRVDVMFDSIVSAKPLIEAGKLRAFAVTSAKRSLAMPDVPTVAEAGLPGFEVAPWYAFFAPAKTPPQVIARLNAIIVKTMNDPALRERLGKQGIEPFTTTPEEADRYVRAEVVKWGALIKRLNIKVD